jgi:hypothetical protein
MLSATTGNRPSQKENTQRQKDAEGGNGFAENHQSKRDRLVGGTGQGTAPSVPASANQLDPSLTAAEALKEAVTHGWVPTPETAAASPFTSA